MSVSIKGIQEAQDANLKLAKALEPGGAAGAAVKGLAIAAHAYAEKVTHVDTGALRASHRIKPVNNWLRAEVHLDPTARNPRSHIRTEVYGFYEHERGGSHAFYARTVEEAGPRLLRASGTELIKHLPK